MTNPVVSARLVSSVMADHISTCYFFVQNSINNFHNLSARNILLLKYSFLKALPKKKNKKKKKKLFPRVSI